jgi:hypothetical protein
MDALKNRGDHCHMGGTRASAPGLDAVRTLLRADIASNDVRRHPEVAA